MQLVRVGPSNLKGQKPTALGLKKGPKGILLPFRLYGTAILTLTEMVFARALIQMIWGCPNLELQC